ncbi:DUF2637 domain-containing protein [Rhodococcus qingshengii]|uniref:DUF2637 domain-containing protein n=1 Tax=Rhodococcus qingshengii TaxID=334542 RepID=A0A2A5J2I5_RHOSG|nr:DUF2637 domain-containing protein [Rhodococcus qingshengii]PCK23191.1 hypothetical protein CHR55_30710 [Rhodococcus qingshengii]
MTDLNLRAARIQLYGLIAAVALAILIAIGITTGAFVLSFSVLRDLATQGLLPAHYAWIFPAIVDGAIFGSTIAIVLLSKINGNAKGRLFFVFLLVAVVCISVVGNAYHAYQAATEAAHRVTAGVDLGFTPLTPTAAALIAVIPPLLVLAFTHGIGLLIKAIGDAYSEYNALVNTAETTGVTPEVVAPVVAAQATAIAEQAATPALASVSMPAEPAADAIDVAHEVLSATDGVAPGVPPVAPVAVAPVAPVASDARDVALFKVVAPDVASAEPAVAASEAQTDPTAPEQTTAALLKFIDRDSGLSDAVRKTARLKILNPDLSFAAIAEETGKVAASTAMRRYNKAEAAAFAAGFEMPPLPDLGEIDFAGDDDRDFDEVRELVTS